jgi:transcriptional regulator with XRE-family HTH domain
MAETIPYEQLSVELIRAVRGRHHQVVLSRRLGYESNIVYRWESTKCWPSAAVFLQLCKRVGINVADAFRSFYNRQPDWLVGDPCSPAIVAAFLRDLQGKVPLHELAEIVGENRYTIARWLSGRSQPRLPDFLRMVEASSRRSLDFVSTLTDPANIPCIAKPWRRLLRAKQVAYDAPWSHAVLHALELGEFGRSRADSTKALVKRLGISEKEVAQALHALQEAGQVRRHRGGWKNVRNQTVNTAQDPARARQLKAFWFQVAVDRLRADAPGFFGYSLFAITEQDLRRLREVQLEYIRQMQSIIAESSPGERVGLYAVQLLDLAEREDNVFARSTHPARRSALPSKPTLRGKKPAALSKSAPGKPAPGKPAPARPAPGKPAPARPAPGKRAKSALAK